jgi:hypothetical protein
MKYFLFFFCIALFSINSYAQNDLKSPPSDFDDFVSNSGGIVKIEEYKLPAIMLQASYGETRIRKVSSESKVKLYYEIASGDYTGSILVEDFPALLNAFETLKAQIGDDIKPVADVLVKKYVYKNGFELGYIVEGKKAAWFIKQHRYCLRTLHIKDPFTIEESLKQASVKFDELI